MRHAILIAGVATLAVGAPVLAADPISLHGTGSSTQTAQAQPLFPPAASITVPIAPPTPQEEIRPPAPSPTYVWAPGHWSWNGMQYFWVPGKYVERPASTATYVAGHWEQQPNGWVWVDGHWDYPGIGSSAPPVR
jgi:WXXGXW repeat (2 copies)